MPLAQNHIENIGSAQVKSSLLASFLNCPGISTIEEKKISRNHTELFLKKINNCRYNFLPFFYILCEALQDF